MNVAALIRQMKRACDSQCEIAGWTSELAALERSIQVNEATDTMRKGAVIALKYVLEQMGFKNLEDMQRLQDFATELEREQIGVRP